MNWFCTSFTPAPNGSLRHIALTRGTAKGRFPQAPRSGSWPRSRAGKTGGLAWFPRMTNAFPDVMQGIMQSIGTQYRLVYETRVRGFGQVPQDQSRGVSRRQRQARGFQGSGAPGLALNGPLSQSS
jgi:hypothetical protein